MSWALFLFSFFLCVVLLFPYAGFLTVVLIGSSCISILWPLMYIAKLNSR